MANTRSQQSAVRPHGPWWAVAWLVCAVLVGCSSYPMGMSEAEWLRITPKQQLQARNQQLEHDRLAEQRRLAEAQARQLQAQLEAQRQAAELQTRRREARYGERLQCVLQPAEAWLLSSSVCLKATLTG